MTDPTPEQLEQAKPVIDAREAWLRSRGCDCVIGFTVIWCSNPAHGGLHVSEAHKPDCHMVAIGAN